jgi:hypothetical protein
MNLIQIFWDSCAAFPVRRFLPVRRLGRSGRAITRGLADSGQAGGRLSRPEKS